MYTNRPTDQMDFEGLGRIAHWEPSLTLTICKEDLPIVVVGYIPLYDPTFGVAQAWGLFHPEARGTGGYIIRTLKEFDNKMMGIFWRLHTMVDSRDENAMHFVISLGYEPESVLAHAGLEGQDMIMYRRLQ